MRDLCTTGGLDLHLSLELGVGRRTALERALRQAIRDGRLAAGSKLPSTRALAHDLGLARGTVVGAYAQLAAEGYLRAQGSATRVAIGGSVAESWAYTERALERPRFDLRAGRPNLDAFPRAQWVAALRQSLRVASSHLFDYGDPRGDAELRRTLAGYLARARGVLIPPDRLIICSGFVQGLGLVTRALRDRGVARMAMEDPCIPEHRTIVGASGLAVRPLLVDGDGAQVAELARLGVGAVTLTPAHQAILGVTLSPTRRADVLAWARTTGGLVLEDDYDGEFRFDRQPVGALQGLDAHRVIYAGTASKTLMPGLRLAWLAVPSDWLEPVVEAKRLADRHTGILDQLALAELLASGAFDRHIRRMRIQYRRRRDYVVGALAERVPALQPSSIAAGLHLVIELPRDWPSEGEVIRRAAERGIAILGVQRGWHGGQLGPQAIMVGYAAPPDHAFPAAVRALVNVLADCAPVRSR